MINYTKFEDSLCVTAGLFSLSKTQTDLFLLLQCGMITYRQLGTTGIHGKTETSGRLSLKKAEQEGLVKSTKITDKEQVVMYTLTAKGKALALDIFSNILHAFEIEQDRLQVPSARQLYHRIRTNDFYCAYIAQPYSVPLIWKQEHALPHSDYFYAQQPPRCDGYLKSECGEYYVEQDNGTQSETVLLKKIRQYIQSRLFDTGNATLVFCLALPKQKNEKKKPSYSIYKILLKFSKLWSVLENEHGISLDYEQFMEVLEQSPLRTSVSVNELRNFCKLHQIHPDADSIDELNRLRQAYLHDKSDLETAAEELDSFYLKRLKSHFRAFYKEMPELLPCAYEAKAIFAVPNHRLTYCLPFIMHKELDLKTILLHCLYCNGLNTDNWNYSAPIQTYDCLFFKYGFTHEYYGSIVFETPNIDLGAIERVRYLMNYCGPFEKPLVLVLLGLDEVQDEYMSLIPQAEKKNVRLVRTKNMPSHKTYAPVMFYNLDTTGRSLLLECDEFDEQLRLIESGVIS